MLSAVKMAESFIHEDGTPCVKVCGIDDFAVEKVFDCGQCFRFDPVGDSRYAFEFEGVAMGRYVRFAQNDGDNLYIYNSTVEDYEKIWKHYLALDADYSQINRDIAAHFPENSVMPSAMLCGKGIRILRQDPWETVCSFIVSQNNNIPRIKKIIAAMSEKWGKPIKHRQKTYYSFPTAEALYAAGEGEIFALKTGFRAGYIYDAARRCVMGDIDFDEIDRMTFAEAEKKLCEIRGVGPKVASCALLFGFSKTEAFPIDVWIKRVIAKYFPDGLDIDSLGPYAGIAQQYLFYYERYFGGEM